MYFPYLRGRQNEMLALTELQYTAFNQGKVIPIIEPVQLSSLTAFQKLAKADVRFILVINPIEGILATPQGETRIDELIIKGALSDYQNYILGYVISPTTGVDDVTNFLTQYPKYAKAIIHHTNFFRPDTLIDKLNKDSTIQYQVFFESRTNNDYRLLFNDRQRVLLRDGFTRQETNAAYPEFESFGSLHRFYKSYGYIGFGDFLIVGDYFSERGGMPVAVVIHFTYVKSNGDFWIAHFISDDRFTKTNLGGKFGESLKKLMNFIEKNGLTSSTSGIIEFENLYAHPKRKGNDPHFPGLGAIKKMSLKHHIELMEKSL